MTRSAILGRPVEESRFVLDRDDWAAHRKVETRIEGLEPCLRHFGTGPSGEDDRLPRSELP